MNTIQGEKTIYRITQIFRNLEDQEVSIKLFTKFHPHKREIN